jgi:hypothetical protein
MKLKIEVTLYIEYITLAFSIAFRGVEVRNEEYKRVQKNCV